MQKIWFIYVRDCKLHLELHDPRQTYSIPSLIDRLTNICYVLVITESEIWMWNCTKLWTVGNSWYYNWWLCLRFYYIFISFSTNHQFGTVKYSWKLLTWLSMVYLLKYSINLFWEILLSLIIETKGTKDKFQDNIIF